MNAVLKKVLMGFGICVLVLWCIRVYIVNANAEKPVIEISSTGDFVAFENDFYMDASENRNGYEVRVNRLEIISRADYLQTYDKENLYDPHPLMPELDYICLLQITVKNGESDSYIDAINLYLRADFDNFQISDDLLAVVHPNLAGQLGFRLRPNTEMELLLPYAPNPFKQQLYSYTSLCEAKYELLLSMYPTKKAIAVSAHNAVASE